LSDDPFSDPDAEVPDFPPHESGSTDDDGNAIGGLAVERTATAEDFPPADFTEDDEFVSPTDVIPPDDLPDDPENYVSDAEVRYPDWLEADPATGEVPEGPGFVAEGNEGHLDPKEEE
jgi:hypothetical protein